jgi:hypothetical protein
MKVKNMKISFNTTTENCGVFLGNEKAGDIKASSSELKSTHRGDYATGYVTLTAYDDDTEVNVHHTAKLVLSFNQVQELFAEMLARRGALAIAKSHHDAAVPKVGA